ncbi:hypothetical protein BDQ12DRAFT_158107 [Crucibulum laeve]|uniref:Uncharacterized protein n=1 Tax=Crucibulum laeve TaxID=68775 RepID=A0A5C3LXV8_9AGAR|nr:hypothetical protein BDQ12DRAFT_158107 [Crucibulum laeve]
MKFTSSYIAILLLAVTLSSAVPLGQPSYDQRDLSEDADLYAREPGLFGAIAKIGGKIFHHKHSNQRREPLMDDMDLESRGLFRIGAEGGRLRLGHGPVVHPNQRREPVMDAEELESRGLSNWLVGR